MVCAAIEKGMIEKFLPRPTPDTWKEVAQRFWEKCNFPNCLGALDGKLVIIQAHHCLVANISITKRHSLLCFWHLWMLTTDSGAFRWKTSGEQVMAGCTQDRTWEEEWRARHCMSHKIPLCLMLLTSGICLMPWWLTQHSSCSPT